jgi:hypothetical protein
MRWRTHDAPKRMGALTFHEGNMDTRTPLHQAARSAALSIEFIAKHQETHRLREAILTTVQDGLGQVPGFVRGLVMISDREARLITVITFWTREEETTFYSKRARWVRDLLMPYVDHCLRVQTLDAYLSALPSASRGAVQRESAPQVETSPEQELPLCVA